MNKNGKAEDRKKIFLEYAETNLRHWKSGGHVKTLKIYTAPETATTPSCASCSKHQNEIVAIADAEIGATLPPFKCCLNKVDGCKCVFRPDEFFPFS